MKIKDDVSHDADDVQRKAGGGIQKQKADAGEGGSGGLNGKERAFGVGLIRQTSEAGGDDAQDLPDDKIVHDGFLVVK